MNQPFSLSLSQHELILYGNQTLLAKTCRVYPYDHKVTALHRLSSCQAYKKYHSSITSIALKETNHPL